MNEMNQLHDRIQAAIKRAMSRDGITEREAFACHMKHLMAEAPKVAAAYMRWLMK